jgi:uncharacterized protein (UPF0332 family)
MTEELATAYFSKAKRALSEARSLLADEATEGACNRAYYAMFDAAHAVLWTIGGLEPGDVIKTHSGLISAFGAAAVKTGKLAPEHGRALGQVYKIRLLADYTADPPAMRDAEEAVTLATAFLDAVGKLI